jgi:alcohol dehydrogenase YqhD (iron-dependent ADH family)
MQNFSFNSTKGIRFGKDISLQTIDEVSGLLGSNILFVTDPGLNKLGLANKVLSKMYWDHRFWRGLIHGYCKAGCSYFRFPRKFR